VSLDPAWYEHTELEILPRGWGPADELEVFELGDRVSEWQTYSLVGQVYSAQRDRWWAAISNMVAAVAVRTSRRGLPFPAEWLPDTDAWDRWQVM
jgi:hypothetical protein